MNKFLKIFLSAIIIIVILIGGAYLFASKAGAFQTRAWLEKQDDLAMDEEVVINFSDAMSFNNISDRIKISPSGNINFVWENSNKKLRIIPRENWRAGETYNIKIENLKNIFFINNNFELNFNITRYPIVESFFPKNGSRDVIIDIEDPGIVKFDKPLEDFNLKIKVFPNKKLNYNLNKDKDSVSFVFDGGYDKGQKYEITLFIKHKNESKDYYREIYKSSFQAESPPPEEWGKEFGVRLDQARKFTKARIESGKYIDINLKIQVMSIFENGGIIDSFLISSGKRGMDTPIGEYAISNKHPRPWSKQYGLFMPYWMAIVPSGKFGIHELPEWPGGYKEGQNHLGIPVSHGCVRLGVGPAEKVYNWAEIGTPVIVY